MMTTVKWFGNDITKLVEQRIRDNLYTAALMVEADAKRLCPVATGRLRSSITHNVDAQLSAQVSAGGEATDGTIVDYAVFVEMGTSKMAAQPFLRPALEKNKPAIRKLFAA